MKISTRFSVAVHILALLYINREGRNTSEFVASSVTTNSVVIRRILGMLKRAGLVDVSPGVAGASLARDPQEICLLDIYRAVGAVQGSLFDMHQSPNPLCPVGASIQIALEGTLAEAQQAMERILRDTNLTSIVDRIIE